MKTCIERCATHPHITLIHFCPGCRGSIGGTKTTQDKRASNQRNATKPRTKRVKP